MDSRYTSKDDEVWRGLTETAPTAAGRAGRARAGGLARVSLGGFRRPSRIESDGNNTLIPVIKISFRTSLIYLFLFYVHDIFKCNRGAKWTTETGPSPPERNAGPARARRGGRPDRWLTLV
ncbi:hypothetical protein EVAR_76275_1 [Eumeta japonica]|uniref:Uncharacterized protein n=1 Tax=Eumeta variegata TaxID=151549 RepID=A0A4C1UPP0_EUMVA|nr:hypothetical protein EVAR_76275_1 [Eumeta japonica]